MSDTAIVVAAISAVLLLGLLLMALRRAARGRNERGEAAVDAAPEISPSYRARRDLDDRGDADGRHSGGGDD